MGLNNVRLGRYISVSNRNNNAEIYGSELIRGVTTAGKLTLPKGNVSSVNLKPYKIVHRGAFVYNPSRFDLGSIAYCDEDLCIVSHLYIVFYLNDFGTRYINPEWLFLYLRRQEFYREIRFRNFGSQRPEFNFNKLSDTELPLPSIGVQDKYVAIYEAMRANQCSYESGLDDLKLTCDVLLDRCKTSERWMRVGDCVEEVDRRNSDVSCDMAFGININKQFMVSKASSDDLHNYKLVAPGELAYSSMQTGRDKCIRIALHEGHEDIAVSPAYSILQEKSDSMLPIKYLMVWFSRPEMDRLGWFLSDASIRANLDLGEFLNIKIPVPDKPVQDAVVKIYDAWKTRAGINERMKERLKDICPILVKGSIEEARR